MQVDGEPVVFCFIAWMERYVGATLNDVPVWAGRPAPGGSATSRGVKIKLGEVHNFNVLRDASNQEALFGFVQSHFDIKRLPNDGERAGPATVIWCAPDPYDGARIKVVGWYRSAYLYPKWTPFTGAIAATDRAKLPKWHTGFNVIGRPGQYRLIPPRDRPPLAVTPGLSKTGRWSISRKIWYGDGSTKLAGFVADLLANALSPQEDDGRNDAPERREYTREVFDRDRVQVRELKGLYGGRCQVSGEMPLSGVAGDITEVHHIDWLTRGGSDNKANMVVLSPDMHRAVHAKDARFDWVNLHFEVGSRVFPLKLNKHLKARLSE